MNKVLVQQRNGTVNSTVNNKNTHSSFNLMTKKTTLGIFLAVVMLCGSVPLGYSEPLKVQLEQGIETNQIQCDNPNHVLVQRTNGKLACVSEKSAEKMNWELVDYQKSTISNIVYDYPLYANSLESEQSFGGEPLTLFGTVELSISNLPKVGETATLTYTYTQTDEYQPYDPYLFHGISLSEQFSFVNQTDVQFYTADPEYHWDMDFESIGKPVEYMNVNDTMTWIVEFTTTGEGVGSIRGGHADAHVNYSLYAGVNETILYEDYVALYGEPVRMGQHSEPLTENEKLWELHLEALENDENTTTVRACYDVPRDERLAFYEELGLTEAEIQKEFEDCEAQLSTQSFQGMDTVGESPYSIVSFPENIQLGEPFDVEIEWQYFDGPYGVIDEERVAFSRAALNPGASVLFGYNSTNVDVFIDTNGEFINVNPEDIMIESLEDLHPHLQFGYQYYEREFDYHPTKTFSEIVTIQFNEWGVDDQLDGLDWFMVNVGYNKYPIYIYSSGDSAILSKEYIVPISQNSESSTYEKEKLSRGETSTAPSTQPSTDPNDAPESAWDNKFVLFLEFYQDENETLAESMLDMGFNEQYIEKFMVWYNDEYGVSTQNFLPSFSFLLPSVYATPNDLIFVSGSSATAYGIANVKENAEGMLVCLYDERNDGTLTKLNYGNSDACSSVRSDGTFTIYGINRDFDSSFSNVDLVVGMESISDYSYITKYNNNHDIAKGEIHRILSLKEYPNNDKTIISNVVIESGSHNVFSRVYELNQHIELAHDNVDNYTHDIEQVIVNWQNEHTSHFETSYVPEDDRISLTRSQYDKPYSIYHEYGHHVMNKAYGYIPADGRNADQCKIHKPETTELPACAWVEGFAEFFAHWVDNRAIMVHQVGNTYDFENRIGLESHNAVFDDGPHVEGNIASMMWDLVDGTGENGNDDIPSSTSDFWDAFASETSPTFHIGDVLEFETEWDKFSSYSINEVFVLNTIRENTDSENPSVDITSPYNRYTSSSKTITVQGESSDNVEVASVKLYINDNLVSTLTSNLDNWTVRVTLPVSTHTIKVVVEDTSGNTSSDSIFVFYDDDNGPPQRAPVIENVRNVRVAEGSSTTTNVRATDANNDSITLSLQDNPGWVSISDNNDGTGLITVNVPDEVSQTSYRMKAVATDNDGTDTDTFRVYISEVNEDPVLDLIGSKTVQERQNLSFTVSASDSDRPSQTLRYSMSGSPTGSTINSSTGLFSWTPSITQSGTYNVTFTVTDNGSPTKSDSENVSIIVINKAPVIPQVPPVLSSINDVIINEGQSKSFTVTATDQNNDSITYSLSNSPDWVSISGDTITVAAPNELPDTSYSGTVTATDNDGADIESFTININEINESPTINSIPDKSAEEQSTIQFTVTASDSDIPAQSLSFSMDDNPEGAVMDGITGLFTWTPNNSQVGTHTITFTVTDNGTPIHSDSQDVTFTITEISDTTPPEAPVLIRPSLFTTDNHIIIRGTAEAGSSITLTHNDLELTTTVITSVGTWGTPITLSEGKNTFTATATDEAGNTSVPSSTVTITLDTIRPETVVFDLEQNTMVNENLITLTGTAEADSSITISYNRYDSYIVTTSDDGTWSVDVTLTEGQNTFFAIATDKADNISDQSMIIILLDTIPLYHQFL